MEKTPGLVAVTKFVRPGSAVYASYINYIVLVKLFCNTLFDK